MQDAFPRAEVMNAARVIAMNARTLMQVRTRATGPP